MSRRLFNIISNLENAKRGRKASRNPSYLAKRSISNKNVIFLPLGGKVRMRGELEQVKLDFLPLDVAQLIPSPGEEG